MSENNSPYTASGISGRAERMSQLSDTAQSATYGRATSVHLPSDLMNDIRFHVATTGISIRELIRTVIDSWILKNAPDTKTVKSGKVDITPAEDRRSVRGGGSDITPVTVWLSKEHHTRLKQLAAVRRATLRGVIIAILDEWNDAEPDSE